MGYTLGTIRVVVNTVYSEEEQTIAQYLENFSGANFMKPLHGSNLHDKTSNYKFVKIF